MAERETELLRIERCRAGDVFYLVADAMNALDELVRGRHHSHGDLLQKPDVSGI